ncbi:MAG: hypothetical protein PHR51_00090 [Patescibacteria group bacterium]|nr:hypothetical protein [Patescibacteria group bacterium]
MDFVIYLLAGVLLVAIVALFGLGLSKKHALTETAVATVQSKWKEIDEMMTSGDQHLWVRAILEADKLVDYVLQEKRIAGETFGERLKNSGALFRNVQSVWEAHKLRNQLVHEVNASINRGQAEQAITRFRAALRELKAL